jgi:hypothetical protein
MSVCPTRCNRVLRRRALCSPRRQACQRHTHIKEQGCVAGFCRPTSDERRTKSRLRTRVRFLKPLEAGLSCASTILPPMTSVDYGSYASANAVDPTTPKAGSDSFAYGVYGSAAMHGTAAAAADGSAVPSPAPAAGGDTRWNDEYQSLLEQPCSTVEEAEKCVAKMRCAHARALVD